MAGTENDSDRNGTGRDEAATRSVALSVVRGLRVALVVPFLVIGALLVAGGTALMGDMASSRLDRLIDRS